MGDVTYVCDTCAHNMREINGTHVVCSRRYTRRKVEESGSYAPEQMCLDFQSLGEAPFRGGTGQG